MVRPRESDEDVGESGLVRHDFHHAVTNGLAENFSVRNCCPHDHVEALDAHAGDSGASLIADCIDRVNVLAIWLILLLGVFSGLIALLASSLGGWLLLVLQELICFDLLN